MAPEDSSEPTGLAACAGFGRILGAECGGRVAGSV